MFHCQDWFRLWVVAAKCEIAFLLELFFVELTARGDPVRVDGSIVHLHIVIGSQSSGSEFSDFSLNVPIYLLF